ncbi:probable basic-leucine zipper transcription factor E [Vespa mandarinia]|uniref:probable basic-leucine zipper transcription factor E n=1 Tax=Vespa mandarinia TaxID=7446 RepID=UPI001618F09F|nr:probable basic-leucine zipper transcription factor E [Vespa mandarinia]
MALRRRRRDDFTNSLNNFQSHNSLKPIVGKKCDINLSNDKDIGNNVFAIENDTKDYSLISQNKISDESYKKFDNVLFVLDSKLNPTEANLTKQEIYKRLSEKYVTSPQKFTERLITIIEESIINNTINASNNSLINFNQISKELNKMCNNIENESMPEKLLSSTINISPNREISKIANSNDSINSAQITNDNYCTDVKTLSSINLNSCKMRTPSPIKTGKKVYRKTPINVFKTQNKRLRDVSLLPSISTDSSFEYLEAQCERLFPNEKKNPISVSTVQDNNSFLTMDRVFTICEQQMASLNSTDDIKIRKKNKKSIEELKRNSKDSGCSHLYSIPESSIYKDEDKNKKLKKVTHKRCKRELDTEYLNSADDLNKSLLSEIVIKRRRCLDTAKKMMEINSECNTMKGEKKSKAFCKSIVDINSNKPKDNDKHFMKILMSCEDYHNYLDDQLTILDASSINSTFDSTINELNKNNKINKNNNKNNINLITSTKKAFTRSNPSISYNENYEKVLARWNIRENIEKISETVLKNNNNSHFFTTPGKMLTKEKHKRKMYFSDSYITKKQISPLKTSTNRNSNYNTKLSLGRIYKNENLKSKRVSLRKLSKQNVTSISKNKENKK